jgi:hypothetical protein
MCRLSDAVCALQRTTGSKAARESDTNSREPRMRHRSIEIMRSWEGARIITTGNLIHDDR